MVQRIEWSPTYELGVEEIDNDHRNLFGLGQEVCEAVGKVDFDLCLTRTERLIDALKKHFAREEEFLDRIGYPDADAHKDFHKLLLARAKKLKQLCADGAESGRIEECYTETVVLLLDEIIRGDAKFKSHVQHHGLGRPPAE